MRCGGHLEQNRRASLDFRQPMHASNHTSRPNRYLHAKANALNKICYSFSALERCDPPYNGSRNALVSYAVKFHLEFKMRLVDARIILSSILLPCSICSTGRAQKAGPGKFEQNDLGCWALYGSDPDEMELELAAAKYFIKSSPRTSRSLLLLYSPGKSTLVELCKLYM